VKLTGDEEGVAELKKLHAADAGSVKFLIEEARTNTDLRAEFRGDSGTLYTICLDPRTGDLVITKSASQRKSKLPGSD